MKTKLLQFVFTALFLPLAYVASAGTVSIDYVWINPNGPLCPAPQNITISVSGSTTGYNWLQDSIDVYINFGDASDTTIKVMLVDSFMNQMFYTSFQHTYQMDGIFSLQIIATAPDQVADTNAQMNAVVIGNNCGTIDGSVYNDLNGDCVYNGNDEPVSFAAVSLLLNNQIVGVSYTDTAGHYWFNAPTNYSYDVKLGNLTQYGFNPLCPSNATINVPTVPSSGNDFFVECINGFDLQGSGYGGAVPGATTPIYVHVHNSTCTPTSGMVKVVLGTHQTYLSAIPTPAYVLGDTVAWNFSNLSNSWNWYNYYTNNFWGTIYFKSDTLIQIGDTICNPMIITPIVGDNNPSNNTVNICIPVVSS
ncbi:MAG: hypothetical protein ACE5DN_05490, partial [Flavobacteriales bacterium]